MSAEIAYQNYKELSVQGRYVVGSNITQFLNKELRHVTVNEIGKSVLDHPISMITMGTGPTRILMWSQMHGNEATTTKAVLDLINYLEGDTTQSTSILQSCTLYIIPILNPDGAAAYTRSNANKIDLNRDAQDLSQPESRVLRSVFETTKPHFCFNLHDQRTMYNVGNTPKPATVSFLAPAYDKDRNVSKTRGISMQLVVAMNRKLQKSIPGQIGRYDDAFNANCVGDAFQMEQVPTVLFEAGHFPEDYKREKTRVYIFMALQEAISVIANGTIGEYKQDHYLEIPENSKQFMDIIIRNAHVLHEPLNEGMALGIFYEETLVEGKIVFIPVLAQKGKLDRYFGHQVYNCLDHNDLEALKANKALTDMIAKI